MIEVENITKKYGGKYAVQDLSFTIPVGEVTGFLGPNGSGKSTTMRLILGLEEPTKGQALIDGVPFRKLKNPAAEVGALLNPEWISPAQTGCSHMRMIANYVGKSRASADDALEAVGLRHAANQRVSNYSLGMRQRLGLATALLGNPTHLFLDEPVNGLDPEGVVWMRERMKQLAEKGCAVFVSSHLMSEMQQTADRLVVIKGGQLVGEGPLKDFLGEQYTEISCDRPDLIEKHFGGRREGDVVLVSGASRQEVGTAAHELGIVVYGLSEKQSTLEAAFLEATREEQR